MIDFIKFLQLPVADQQQQMYDWLAAIAEASEEERQKQIQNLILMAARLALKDRRKVVQIRTEAMLRLPVEQIKAIIRSRYQAMQAYQAENEEDRRFVMETISRMPADAQQKVAQIVAEVREEVASRTI